MILTVYGTENCAGCTTLKNLLDRENIRHEYKDVMEDKNSEEVQKYRIRSLPTAVVSNSDGFEVYHGSDSFGTIVSLFKDQ